MPRLTDTRALRASLPKPPEKYSYEWCSEILGFGARIMASGVRSYVVAPRSYGKPCPSLSAMTNSTS